MLKNSRRFPQQSELVPPTECVPPRIPHRFAAFRPTVDKAVDFPGFADDLNHRFGAMDV